LSGTPPFEEPDTVIKIVNCEYSFDEKVWDTLSKESRSFVTKILKKDPEKRLNF
jgi:hypothetical protein